MRENFRERPNQISNWNTNYFFNYQLGCCQLSRFLPFAYQFKEVKRLLFIAGISDVSVTVLFLLCLILIHCLGGKGIASCRVCLLPGVTFPAKDKCLKAVRCHKCHTKVSQDQQSWNPEG